ncbi:MAG: single-stranded-DNA-specific exonuclease RecJ [Clostridia bacterium]|nr:single-stranded-DNA-specific exonuclease RecJ [Clostridia bacterium]
MFDRNCWQVSEQSPDLVKKLADSLRIHPLCAKLLINRGYTDTDSAKAFVQKSDAFLYNPYLLKDVRKATARIRQALEQDEKITIYGDYDVDGVTSVSILYMYLKERGANVDYYIPTREGEGYGLNIGAFQSILEKGTKLIITVDTGITAIDEIAYANKVGLDVIVTDHHQCRPELPSCIAVVNPRRSDCEYPFKELSGVGVIFKVLCALEMDIVNFGEYNLFTVKDMCKRYIDLVTIGTIADVMPLYDENRIMVYMGLSLIASTSNVGIRALLRAVGIDDTKKINSSTVGYTLAPRINAAGRIGNAARAVQLFLSSSPHAADVIAEELCVINRERQQTENQIFAEALEQIEKEHDIEKESVLVLASSQWHQGVIGIVASKITERFGKPSILISFESSDPNPDELGKGSARSIKGLNMVEALAHCEKFLAKYGGHELAAGLSVTRGNLDQFRKELNIYAKERLAESGSIVKTYIEAEITEYDVKMQTVYEIAKLEPYGAKNPEPIFILKDVRIAEIAPLSMGKHTKLYLDKNSTGISAICFGHNLISEGFFAGDRVDVVCSININEFRGNKTVQLIVRDIDYSEWTWNEIGLIEEEFFAIKDGEIPDHNEQIIPKREDFAAVYRLLKDDSYIKGKQISILKLMAPLSNISYLKAMIILEVFSECELIEWNNTAMATYHIRRLETKEKKNLFEAPIMKLLMQNH